LIDFAGFAYIQTQFFQEEIMTTPIVENLELFSEAQLESLEFLPEELENIEFELYPNLESISPEQVAKDLEAYFEGGVEQTGKYTALEQWGKYTALVPLLSILNIKKSLTLKGLGNLRKRNKRNKK
jgi:hypothetical protein